MLGSKQLSIILMLLFGIAIWAVRDGKLARCWVERAAWELYQKLCGKE